MKALPDRIRSGPGPTALAEALHPGHLAGLSLRAALANDAARDGASA